MIQKLTTSILALSLVMGLTACEVSTTNGGTPNPPHKTTPDDHMEEGGISAGGGGTLPADPIHVFEAVGILTEAKRDLRLIIRNMQKFERSYNDAFEEKFYFAKDNLATKLETTDLEILEDKPCKDKNGRDVDASIHASRPNTICFSAFSVAPKLIIENAHKEIMALLVHELGHFLGANETEARKLQQRTLTFMRGINHEYVETLWKETWGITESFNFLYTSKEKVQEAIKQNDVKAVDTEIQSWVNQLDNYDKPFENKDLALLDYTIKEYEAVMRMKLRFAQIYFDTQIEGDFQEMAKESYAKCFGDQTAVKVKDFPEDCPMAYLNDSMYGEYVISKLTSLADLEEYLVDVKVYLRDLASHTRAIAFTQPLPVFHLPTTPKEVHPWLKFTGMYNATLIGCSSTSQNNYNPYKGLQQLEIQPSVVNYPMENTPAVSVKKISGGMTSTDHYFNDHNGSDFEYMTGTATTAVMTKESGDRWYDRNGHGWNKQVNSIEQINGQLVFTMKQEHFTYDYKGIYQAEASCQYQLTPQ
ncbi:hypothetical protein [Bdellovibrio sp. HCB337]|uniref:hypothetical protein n=1 Tax=Bdellovibrio sp. HCB337 TaxID=3394358 RepID=UPI0039A56F3E